MATISEAGYEKIAHGLGVPWPGEDDATRRMFHAWQAAEGGDAAHNPWNTTHPMAGDSWYNSFGPKGEYHVRNYASEADGIDATVETIKAGLEKYHYDRIVFALRDGDAQAAADAVAKSPWGTNRFTVPKGSGGGGKGGSSSGGGVKLPPIRKGDSGPTAAAVVQLLRGHAAGAEIPDSTRTITKAVLAALEEYQDHHGLDADGIVGPKTWAKLLGL